MAIHRNRETESHLAACKAGLRIAIQYALVGTLWILFSDQLLTTLVRDPAQWSDLQTYKGWTFIAITAVLLAWLVTRMVRRLEHEQTQLERLNRTHRMLSRINGTIVRVRNRDELLDTACQLAIDQGGYELVRIVLRDNDQDLPNVASYMGSAPLDIAQNLSPLTIASGHSDSSTPLLINQLDKAGLPVDWRCLTEENDLGSIASFPIPDWSAQNTTRGWLELGSNAESSFDPREVLLLQEIAADIGLGLETIEKSEHLDTLVHFDPLTGLPNEVLLMDRLRQSLTRAHYDKRVIGVLVAEVPELTRLSDLHGGHLSDRLRKEVAEYLAGVIREGDTVARTGRYSFTLLLTDIARVEDLVELANRILAGPMVKLESEPMPMLLSLRGGAAIFPEDGDHAEALLQQASLALHANNPPPGTCAYYSSDLDEMAKTRLRLVHGLQHAIGRDELSVAYQLLVDTRSERPCGAEALLRWNSPHFGAVSPAQFIPIAEESGVIHTLGAWVLDQACRQLHTWHQAGFKEFYVSVNIAAPQLLRTGFYEELYATLDRHHLLDSANSLVIEVTETAFMEDLARAEQALQDIRRLGVRVYLDDFGTGFCSLSYLSRLPVDALKIDRSFIQDLPDDMRAGSLVKAIIALAHSLGLKVIAEGVETQAQADWLRDWNCNLLQGYLYSKPAAAETLSLR